MCIGVKTSAVLIVYDAIVELIKGCGGESNGFGECSICVVRAESRPVVVALEEEVFVAMCVHFRIYVYKVNGRVHNVIHLRKNAALILDGILYILFICNDH